jgi:predicted SnoaL-like aldol condensation-catalyzing enzyme
MSLEENRQVVVAFYEKLFNDKQPDVAVQEHLGDTYIQHNPSTAGGQAALVGLRHRLG